MWLSVRCRLINIHLGGVYIEHFEGLALLGGLASQSSVHTTKFVFFTSSVCLCVGYKMKTCTQISDSGFRGKINLVSPGDSAKQASPGRRAGFSRVNAR